MKTDKKSLINYDYKIYLDKFNEIKEGIKKGKEVDGLNIDEMKKWSQKGIFCRRLKFRGNNENFYITTASISRGNSYNHDFKFGNDYIIPYWGDQKQRAEILMKFDINDESPFNGKLELIGDFKPFEDNLLDVKYQTISGKEFIEDVKKFINGNDIDNYEDKKIDISNFFRLKFELASQGLQAKALYDTENSIIDGSAGTGKSTIAIQKLKYFYENSKISQDKYLIIVRNEQLKYHFLTLLQDENINLTDIQIKTIDEIFDVNKIENYDLLISTTNEIKKNIENKISNRGKEYLEKHYIHLLDFIGVDFIKEKILELLNDLQNENNINKISNLQKKIDSLYLEKDTYLHKQNNYIDEIEQEKRNLVLKLEDEIISEDKKLEYKDEIELIEEEIYKYHSKLMDFDKEIKNIQKDIDKLEGKHYEKILNSITKDTKIPISILDDLLHKLYNTVYAENIEVLKWLVEYKNYLVNQEKNQKKVDILKAKLQEKISTIEKNKIKENIEVLERQLNKNYKNANRQYFNKYTEVMKNVYFSRRYLENKNLINNDLVYKILNIDKKEFDTIIVDEAQDFSKYELELIRLHTDRIVLTGDILQNIDSKRGLSNWNELLNINFYKNDKDELNKYTLKHNFRQTYQLANASYNYRQILLDGQIEDIGFDYFENEKIFNGKEYSKPILKLLETDLQIIEFIGDKIKYIDKIYSERFPIIIVYKDKSEKDYYLDILSDYSISDNKNDINSDIVLLGLNSIKGNEFPIVVANMSSFTEKELYLIMTRAQFELEFFIKNYDNFNPIIYKLIQNKEYIQFLDLKNIELNKIKIDNKSSTSIKEAINKDDIKINNKEILEFQEKIEKQRESFEINKNSKQEDWIKVKEQITKHKAETSRYDEQLDIDIITNEEVYEKEFLKKVQHDIKELNSEQQNEVVKEIVIVRKKSTSKIAKNQKDKIKDYLFKTYKGYCQICGFSFRKVSDGKNYFEIFNWNDKRVVKQKKSFITTADSLCLCRNCSANIKWGAFEPIFINKINQIEDFSHQSLDKVKEIICEKLDNDIVEKFKEDYEWNDMFALKITLNNKPKNIYFTNGHLIQFITYLKLEEK